MYMCERSLNKRNRGFPYKQIGKSLIIIREFPIVDLRLIFIFATSKKSVIV